MIASELARGVIEASPGSDDFVEYARSLASLAFSRNRKIAAEATQAVFDGVVQPLADRFDGDACDLHAAFLAEVLWAPGSPIRGTLLELGFSGPQALIERYGMLRDRALQRVGDYDDLRKVVVLSRVESKADVAVTSMVWQSAIYAFRDAEVDLLAPKENAYLIGNPYRIHRRIISYPHHGPLAKRLLAWKRWRDKVQASIEGFQPGHWLVVDPDSCVTQNGLLPLADDRYVEFFESRSYGEGSDASLAELAAEWCDKWYFWGGIEEMTPYVAGRSGSGSGGWYLGRSVGGRLAGVSFATDGKDSARLGTEFEDALLELLRKRGYSTVLDGGRDESAAANAAARVRAFRGTTNSLAVLEDGYRKRAKLMTYKGTYPSFAGWVSRAIALVGYDSAVSHVVAATGVPVIQVCAGAPNPVYRARWTPMSWNEVVSIPAQGPSDGPRVLKRIETELKRIEADNPRPVPVPFDE